MKNESAKLNQDITIKKITLIISRLRLDTIDELEIRGFGISELRTLINMLNEIGMRE